MGIGGYWPLYEDGTPVSIGDLVMGVIGPIEVSAVEVFDNGTNVYGESESYGVRDRLHLLPGEHVDRAEPDSWERLEKDARKDPYDYWSCRCIACGSCPALVDGKSPCQRYDTDDCEGAVAADIVRRAKALAGVVDDE